MGKPGIRGLIRTSHAGFVITGFTVAGLDLRCGKSRVSPGGCRDTMMSFDQGEFNFEAKGSEDGFRKWREELDVKKRAFETRWGVILSRRVSVALKDHTKPLVGMLDWKADPKKGLTGPPVFKLRGLEFTASEIESIVQLEEPETPC